MTEYTGQLLGGPDNGNLVSASVTEIEAQDTLYLWLDGKEEDKEVTIFETTGKYVWNGDYFSWIVHDNKVYAKKAL